MGSSLRMPTIRSCWRTGWMFSRRSIARSIEQLALRAQLSWHHVEGVRLHRYGLGRRSEMDRSDAVAEVPQVAPLPVSAWRFYLYFLRLGTFGFGGPIALAGFMQRDLVEERRWISREDYMDGLALSQLALAGAHSGAVLSSPSLAAHGEGLCRRRERGCDGCDRWRSVRVGHSGFDGRRNRFCRRRNLRRALEVEDLGAMADRRGGGAGRAREGMNASLGAPAHRTTLLEDR